MFRKTDFIELDFVRISTSQLEKIPSLINLLQDTFSDEFTLAYFAIRHSLSFDTCLMHECFLDQHNV